MSDNVFLDTNILVFSYSYTEPLKQQIARHLVSENNSVISTQVLQELVYTLTRKFKYSYPEAANVIRESRENSRLHINTESSILLACTIAKRYGFSFYDCVIISAALESDSVILYSEDMSHGQVIENKLKIVNPFLVSTKSSI